MIVTPKIADDVLQAVPNEIFEAVADELDDLLGSGAVEMCGQCDAESPAYPDLCRRCKSELEIQYVEALINEGDAIPDDNPLGWRFSPSVLIDWKVFALRSTADRAADRSRHYRAMLNSAGNPSWSDEAEFRRVQMLRSTVAGWRELEEQCASTIDFLRLIDVR